MQPSVKILFPLSLLLVQMGVKAYAESSEKAAQELNSLYAATQDCGDGKADFYCSGIILHAKDLTSAEPWYLSTARDVGSFSYLRRDIVSHVGRPIWDVSNATGYILTPPNELQNTMQFPYDVYCSFPSNGFSYSRTAHSCGDARVRHMKDTDYSNCASKGIFSLSQYMAKYSKQKTVTMPDGKKHIITIFDGNACSFSPNKMGFKLSMDSAKYIYREHPELGCVEVALDVDSSGCWANNELIVSAWPKEKVDVSQVPIKAFYVLINGGESYSYDVKQALRLAFKKSAEYSEATHQSRQIPVVVIDMGKIKDGSVDIFAPAPTP